MTNWITQNWIELLGALSGLLYIILEIRQHLWMWYIGIVTSALYVIVFYTSGLFADMGLNIYYVTISVYGWYCWKNGLHSKQTELQISKITFQKLLILLVITASLTFIIQYFLINYTSSTVPFWDALVTSASIVATWMLAKKILEQWIFWIVINAISIGLFMFKELYITSVLFLVYGVLAFLGYAEWKKEFRKNENN